MTVAIQVVGLGSQVLLRSVQNGDLQHIKLVKQEAREGRHTNYKSKVGNEENGVLYVSDASPLGRALLGKARGEIVTIEAPAGLFSWEIVELFS